MSRGLFVFLSCLVAVLAVVCCLLTAALVHLVYQQQATTGTVTLLSSDVNLTAANSALEKAVFPIPVSPLCTTRPVRCICIDWRTASAGVSKFHKLAPGKVHCFGTCRLISVGRLAATMGSSMRWKPAPALHASQGPSARTSFLWMSAQLMPMVALPSCSVSFPPLAPAKTFNICH